MPTLRDVTDTITRTCTLCGTQAEGPADGCPPGWSFSVERERMEYQCPPCVRANIRSIEGKLPTEYW